MIIRHLPAGQNRHMKRVAAYCRVSSLLEGQEESLDVQKRYYKKYISARQDWEYAGIYSDAGVSGTSVHKRQGFQEMICDALAKKIDIILVKSISRFSRNAVECQQYVHLLRETGVRVFFEKEGIDSLNPGSDLVFSIRAAFAQEESRIISENVRWTYRKNFASGIYRMGSNRILGYSQREGSMIPNEDAQTVRIIFEMYADGVSLADIRRELQARGAKRLRSNKPFDVATLRRILKNEWYVGDLKTMKSQAQRQVKGKKNPEDVERYWENHHTAIISREIWDRVQDRLENTGKKPKQPDNGSLSPGT